MNASNLAFYEGSPGLDELRNVVFIPASSRPDKGIELVADGGLYDLRGNICSECLRQRGPERFHVFGGPSTISPPAVEDEITDEVLYLGFVPSHFGHMITDGFTRAWAVKELNWRGRILLHLGHAAEFFSNSKNIIRQMCDVLGIDVERIVSPDRPMLLRRVIIPRSAFTNRVSVYSIFPKIFEPAAKAYAGEQYVDPRPVYLAKTGLAAARRISGEEDLVHRLSSRGVRAVEPEKLPLANQVELINSHRTIIGYVGSQLYLQLFSVIDGKTIILNRGEPIVSNHRMAHWAKQRPLVSIACDDWRVISADSRGVEKIADSVLAAVDQVTPGARP